MTIQPSMTADAAIRIVLHSAEGVHFHHNIRYIRQGQPRIIILSMRIINRNFPLTYPSTSTSPYELGLPNLATARRELHRHFTHKTWSCHCVTEAAFGVTPMELVEREPILMNINFQLSPTLFQVLRLYGKVGIVSHPKYFHQFLSPVTIIFTVKRFNRMKHHSKV